jgi:hypothetical protein
MNTLTNGTPSLLQKSECHMISENVSNPVLKDDEKKEVEINDEKQEVLFPTVSGQQNGFSYMVFHPFDSMHTFKAINMKLPLHVTISNMDTDDVSILYEESDWEQEYCLPQSTIDVLEFVFRDESEEW